MEDHKETQLTVGGEGLNMKIWLGDPWFTFYSMWDLPNIWLLLNFLWDLISNVTF